MDENTIIPIAMCFALVIVVLLFVNYHVKRRKEAKAKIERLAKTRAASTDYLQQLSNQAPETPQTPETALLENAEIDPEVAAAEAEFSGKFYCEFGISSAAEKVNMAIGHAGTLHITSISVYAHGDTLGQGLGAKIVEGAAGFRVDPARSHGYYDPEIGVISLCDSANPKRWLILRPRAELKKDSTSEEAFTAVVASLIAVMGARLEARPLRGTSMGGVGKLILTGIVSAVIVGVVIVLKILARQPH